MGEDAYLRVDKEMIPEEHPPFPSSVAHLFFYQGSESRSLPFAE